MYDCKNSRCHKTYETEEEAIECCKDKLDEKYKCYT